MSVNEPHQPAPAPSRNCPACGAPLTSGAVLCVACGYHLTLGRHLATSVEKESSQPPDSNPYAASASINPQSEAPRPGEPHVADLTETGARSAKAIVDAADSVYLVALLATCCCMPAWLFLFPWYSWQLWSWYQLNSQFHELRHPYGFSPYAELAVAFRDCRFKLWVGVIVGATHWILAALATATDLVRIVFDSP